MMENQCDSNENNVPQAEQTQAPDERLPEREAEVTVKCDYCKAENVIPKSAMDKKNTCAQCGRNFTPLSKANKITCGCMIVILILAVIGIFWGIKSCRSTPEKAEKSVNIYRSPSKYEMAKKEHQNPLTGASQIVVDYVKSKMKDPNSFEHVGTYWEEAKSGDRYMVKMIYRGKNSFNAVITEAVVVMVSFDGKIISIKETTR